MVYCYAISEMVYCILNFARHGIYHVGIVRHGIEADRGCNIYIYIYIKRQLQNNDGDNKCKESWQPTLLT